MFNRKLKERVTQLEEQIRVLQKKCEDHDCAAGKHRYGYSPYGFYSLEKCTNCGHLNPPLQQPN